jgi:hypothetical protein
MAVGLVLEEEPDCWRSVVGQESSLCEETNLNKRLFEYYYTLLTGNNG